MYAVILRLWSSKCESDANARGGPSFPNSAGRGAGGGFAAPAMTPRALCAHGRQMFGRPLHFTLHLGAFRRRGR